MKIIKTAEPVKNPDGTTTLGIVEGIEFELYNSDNVLVGTYTTDAEGLIAKDGIEPGTYKIHENAPEGYRQPSDRTIEIKPNQTTTVKYHNVISGGDLTIKKATDFNGYIKNDTEPFIFKVEGLSNGFETEVEIYPNRSVTISLPQAGAYKVTEILSETQKLYWQEPDQPSQEVVVNDNEQKTVTFNNHEKYGNFKLKKTADDGVIENVEFKIYGTSNSGAEINISTKTDVNGEAIFDNIPIGRYTLSEVGQADRYVTVIDSDFDINWDETTIMLVNNELKKGEIRTKAKDKATDCGYAYVNENTTLIDTVTYQDLGTNTEYTVEGVLMDKSTGEQLLVNGNTVTASKTFTTTSTGAGEVDVEFNFNSTSLRGKSVVVFEQLYYNGVALASHKDINDIGQTVTFKDPKVGTTAKDVFTDGHEAFVSETTTIVDRVEYTGLIVGKEYTVTGVLMNKATGEPLLVDGVEIISSSSFTAETENGYIDITFTFDSSALKGESVVAFETLTYEDIEVATHTDINDDGQTVTFEEPKLSTTATDKNTEAHYAYINTTTTITDVVEYSNLIVGKEYTVKGILMNKATGEALLVDGAEVTATKTFTAETSNGTVEVEFTFNSSALKGTSVVVFETLYFNDLEVATHSDITDDGQTVVFLDPKAGTTAKDLLTGDNYTYVSETTTIVDTVAYEDLLVGKEYTVKGILMNKETGEPLLIDGAKVTSEKTFTAEAKNGTVDIIFELNSTSLKGKSVVVFEHIYYNDLEVASHADISDEGQTVTFKDVDLKTTTKDKTSGKNTAKVSKTTTIVDTVKYSNLIVGKEYTVSGVLMSKETGKPFLVDGKQVTATKTFKATTENGSVDVEFTFDSSALEGKSVVVFETLYFNNLEVAVHADINDKGQTVTFEKPDEIESSGTPDTTESTGTPDQIDSTGKPDTTESTPYTGSKVPYVLISLFISSAGVIMLSRKRENN